MTGAVAVLFAGIVVLLGLLSAEKKATHQANANAHLAAQREANRLIALRFAAVQRNALVAARGLLEDQGRLTSGQVPITQTRRRPVQPGLAIGAGKDQSSVRGVLTAFVTDWQTANLAAQTAQVAPVTRKTYLLTMPLVLSTGPLRQGLPVDQPPPAAGKDPNEADLIAKVAQWVEPSPDRLNHAVGVIAEVTLPPDEWSPKVYGFGPITRAGTVRPGAEILMVGASAVLKSGLVTGTGARSRIRGLVPDKDAEFDNLISIRAVKERGTGKDSKPVLDDKVPFSQPGDIGAPVLTPEGELVGVVLAARTNPYVTYALPIGSVLDALQVELIRQPASAR